MIDAWSLAATLGALLLGEIVVRLPSSGREVQVATLLRHERRATTSIERASHCWAPNKVAIELDGEVTWPEFAIVRLLERAGWDARWIKNWSGGRESCARVGEPRPLAGTGALLFDRIHEHAPGLRGAGTWDVVAWRGADVLFLESKQHQSSDRLRESQLAFLEAAIEIGVEPAAFAVVEYDAGRPAGGGRAVLPSPAAMPRFGPGVDLDERLDALCTEAAAAPANQRVDLYRDSLASFGSDALRAMEAWVDAGRSPGFAIAVSEEVGRRGDPDGAMRTLGHIGSRSTDWANITTAAIDRLRTRGLDLSVSSRTVSPVDEPYTSGPHTGSAGPCEVRNRNGTECHNPGWIPVGDLMSCTTHYKALRRRGLAS